MGIRAVTLRVLLEKGAYSDERAELRFDKHHTDRGRSLPYRFGWVNASYVYGLQIVNAHMRRALGACTPYDTFCKATTPALDLDLEGLAVGN